MNAPRGGHPDDPAAGSPLDFMIGQQAQGTLAQVERAVDRGDAVLAFQPVVQSDRPGQAAFHEGLIRIIDDTGRVIPLRDFLPAAEATDLGRRIDCLALGLGLQTLTEEPGLRLAINMSARSIAHPAWMATLHDGLRSQPGLGERLILEITESSAMGLPHQVRGFMAELQDRGVAFALDDFGAGHTSFRYLRDFNFDMIKIDGQFIREIAQQRDNQVLARALQAIAHHFDMFTVAEHVETAEDAAFLIGMGIDCLQGYYFGAPTITPPWRTPHPTGRQRAG